jgi:hypothetical protein
MPIAIARTDTDFCETGFATLKAEAAGTALIYTWLYRQLQSESMLPFDDDLLVNEASVNTDGYYQASATNGECSNVSNILKVDI